VGAEETDDDDETFAEKMACLTKQLKEQMEEGEKLDHEIRKQLKMVGYGF
jgi:type I restriction enzyme M protein